MVVPNFNKSRSPPTTPNLFQYDLGPGLLFASTAKSATGTPHKPSTVVGRSPGTPSTNYDVGYLAFPAGYNSPYTSHKPEIESKESKPPEISDEHSRSISSTSESQVSPEHIAKISQETAEALRGEEEWVRSGGILRDADGHRDFKRTQEIREELRLREVERKLLQKWEGYESRWKELMKRLHEDRLITFDDIPWPVCAEDESENLKPKKKKGNEEERKPIILEDLTTRNVGEFLLGPLRVRGSTISRKERIRASLLRWHPDKLTGLLAKVVENDRQSVENGIGIVVRALHELNNKST
ncbi:hypothetical protein E1B28_003345 [Marasmius oreades]|uniref:Uncharacterized protein n=1 Tax=Marasmius oreades TaxID=181124 RepID=A0A9P7UKN3_9AGAR|nr:uncharacterized protein E1B28_003345 [Marasmius oreades]KAG7085805.1 hypothetical protein E1B28_003345 [Marasmius oreades]